jgi:hypothetical protein
VRFQDKPDHSRPHAWPATHQPCLHSRRRKQEVKCISSQQMFVCLVWWRVEQSLLVEVLVRGCCGRLLKHKSACRETYIHTSLPLTTAVSHHVTCSSTLLSQSLDVNGASYFTKSRHLPAMTRLSVSAGDGFRQREDNSSRRPAVRLSFERLCSVD